MKLFRVSLVLAVVCVCGIFLQAQTAPDLENGFKNYGSYHGSDIDTVNLMNGNLMVHIPMPWTYPQRGGDINPKNLLTMSSKTWQPHCVPMDPNPAVCFWSQGGTFASQMVSLAGSGLGFDHTMDLSLHREWSLNTDFQGNPTYFSGGYELFTADGASHQLAVRPNAPLDPNGDPMTYDSNDTSGFHIDLSSPATDGTPTIAIITDRHGNIYQGTWFTSPCRETRVGSGGLNEDLTSTKQCSQATRLDSITDANGNVFTNILDTMGRPFDSYSSQSSSADPNGCVLNGHPFSSSSIVSYAGPNGATNQAKLCYATVNVATAFGISGVNEAQSTVALANGSPATATLLVTVILPDNNNAISASSPKLVFNYDTYLNLTYIGLPTGGSLSYTWQMLQSNPGCPGSEHASRAIASRTLTDNNGHSYIWNYHFGNPFNGTTTVTDPLGNDSVHTFSQVGPIIGTSCPAYETTTQSFQGSGGTRQLLKQVDTTYSGSGKINVVPISIQTTLYPSGKVSLVTKQYDLGLGANQPIFGNVTVELEYDWGGALLRETDTTYQWQIDSRYLTAHLLDLPASVIVKDGSGNRVEETDYTYDETNYLTAYETTVGALPSGTHVAAPNAVRGNLTSVSKWLNTTNSFIVSHTNWFDTGEAHLAIDPLGHTTTHSYDATYAGTYSTQTCSPTTSGITHCVSGTYDFQTGALSSLTDENGQTSNYTYDPTGRLILAQAPVDPANSGARAQTSLNFSPGNTFPLSVQRTKSITTSLSDSATNFFDGLGRANKGQHVLPNGTATVDTVYDALGRASGVSNPYFTTTDPTYGTTQTLYDALGRAYQTTKQDGSISSVNYTAGNCTLTTDEAGSQRKTCSDALGRLVEVDEPGVPANHTTANYVTLQTDGNFVLYDPTNLALWSTGTSGTTAGPVEVQDDGNLVLYKFRWQAGTYRVPSGATFPYDSCRVGDSLFVGQTLTEGQCLESMSGMTFLLMTHSDIQIYDRQLGQVTFDAGTYGQLGGYAVMQSDGRLAIYSPSNTLLWASTTSGTGANVATLENDGRLIIYSTTWNAGTSQGATTGSIAHPGCDIGFGIGTTGAMGVGSCAVSRNGRYELFMQSDGSLVLYNRSVTPMQALWSTNTELTPLSTGVAMRTLYTYDALGNLICVEQHGNAATGTGCSAAPTADATSPWRVRRFTYDSLSRLLTAKNPESGTISYVYDADGSLLQKTSPAPNQTGAATQTVSYCYDALHRVTGKSYGAQSCPLSSPVVSYTYDSGANAIGKLVSLTDQAGTASYTYDVLGRLSTEVRTLTGANNVAIPKSLSYEYNLDGSLKTLHYPSGAVVTYTPDSAGRVVSAIDGGNGINYATGATYGPDGSLTGFVSGNSGTFAGITNAYTYNKRLQPVSMSATAPSQTLYSVGYDFHVGNGTTGADNGNVFGIYNYKDRDRDQTFTYDSLNRLTSAQNAGTDCSQATVNTQPKTKYWGNSYGYDAWGNMLQKSITKCGAEHLSVTADAHNWIHTAAPDYQYDAAGNMTYDATASLSYTFDQENRLTGASGYAYTYDGDGNRVRKSNGNTAGDGTLYWAMTPGVVAETDLAGTTKSEYVFFDGERVARRDGATGTGGVFYYFSDHLKTASVVTDSTGNIKAESDYYPWGGELQFTNNDSNHYKFTGKERDSETGNDYFGARYNSSSTGRFLTPDPLGGTRIDPQTLNKYSYVRNNPINLIDPTGLYTCADQADCNSKRDVEFEKSRQRDLKSKNGDVKRAADAYGDPKKDGPDGNKVNVGFADLSKGNEGGTTTTTLGADDNGKIFAKSEVVIDSNLSGSDLDAAVGHEGSHVADGQDVVKSISFTTTDFKVGQDITRYQSEQRAYRVSDSILRSENSGQKFACGLTPCVIGKGLTLPSQLPEQVDRILFNSPNYRSNGQPLSPNNQGGSVVNGLTIPH
jgi:RHS repeat-associated protein